MKIKEPTGKDVLSDQVRPIMAINMGFLGIIAKHRFSGPNDEITKRFSMSPPRRRIESRGERTEGAQRMSILDAIPRAAKIGIR